MDNENKGIEQDNNYRCIMQNNFDLNLHRDWTHFKNLDEWVNYFITSKFRSLSFSFSISKILT